MSLGPITIGTVTFIEANQGRYIDQASVVGGLRNEIKISGGSLAKKAVPPVINASVTRLQEKTVTVNAVALTKRATVTINFAIEPGFTTADTDVLVSDLSTFITAANLNLILNGAT